ncbi:hypothetical protein D6745_02810 [Candidatus Woesearchaeota archaeon]|nr:MAG: hypothetical protein D6745_02810 [Candidatus Woesearchaeota archaeon]
MALKDLQVRQGNVDIVVDVVEIGDVREFEKFGRKGRVASAKVKDDSGEMTLSLWNDDIDKVKVGDRIRIINGYVNEWQGEPQLTTGRMGRIEVLEGAEKDATPDEETEKDVTETSDEGEHILTEDEKKEDELPENIDEKAQIPDMSTDAGEKILTDDEKTEEELLEEEPVEEEVVEDELTGDEKKEE